jgi:hypothetical protein
MYESDDERQSLQQLLDRSFSNSSEHLQAIMTPPRRLNADRLIAQLDGVCILNVATVTAQGEPRISAVDGHFLHGHWYFTTDGRAVKARQLAARAAVSAAYTPRDGLGVFCHGRASRLELTSAEFDQLNEQWALMYGASFDTVTDDVAAFRIDPSWLVGFSMTEAEMTDIEATVAARAVRRAAAGR